MARPRPRQRARAGWRARACRCRRSPACRSPIRTRAQPVPRDGATLGEVMLRGNTIMKGYLRNDAATRAAFAHDWYNSGDLAVWHPDGYIEIKDRSKDIIITGGENVSSLEVEECLYRHPRRDGGGGGRAARREVGRDALRVRHAEAGRSAGVTPAEHHRLVPRRTSRTSRCPSTSSSGRCPRPRPARSRSTCCAKPHAARAHERRHAAADVFTPDALAGTRGARDRRLERARASLRHDARARTARTWSWPRAAPSALSALAATSTAAGRRVHAVAMDVRDAASVDAAVGAAVDALRDASTSS